MAEKRFVCVYITCANEKEAEKIANALVEKRLAACANIIPKIRSVYRWKGNVCRGAEALVLAKTVKKNAKKITAVVKGLHSYENPAIVLWGISEGSKEYLKWVSEETK